MKDFLVLVYSSFKYIMTLPEHLIEPIGFIPDFIKDALIDSLNLIPFLFVMFLLIEVLEQYFTKKKHLFVFFMKKIGPLFGSLFASIPQCGFSVIASTLYTKRILSRGTLLSVYLATSDEAIPVLVSEPSKIYLVLPIILVKILVAIVVGYLVDIILTYKANDIKIEGGGEPKEGCCHHHLVDGIKSQELWGHPLKHTFNIFLFILFISILLGYIISIAGTEENLAKLFLLNSPLQPVLTSLVGLIPNCAISVVLTILYVKHTISFGSLVAGLSSAGGLGLLVLLSKNNDKKDTIIILSILVLVSILIGFSFQYNLLGINDLFLNMGIQL